MERNGFGGFWIRFAAGVIDGLILLVTTLVVSLLYRSSLWAAFGFVPGPFNVIEGWNDFAIYWLYTAVLLSSRWQGTLGMLAVGLKITDYAGNRISFARATGRFFSETVSALLLCIGYFMVAFTERKQGLHDKMARTLVVRVDVKSSWGNVGGGVSKKEPVYIEGVREDTARARRQREQGLRRSHLVPAILISSLIVLVVVSGYYYLERPGVREQREGARSEGDAGRTQRFVEDFLKATEGYIRAKGGLGVHSVKDGYSRYMANRYSITEDDVMATVDALCKKGLLYKKAAKGGVMVYAIDWKKKRGQEILGNNTAYNRSIEYMRTARSLEEAGRYGKREGDALQ